MARKLIGIDRVRQLCADLFEAHEGILAAYETRLAALEEAKGLQASMILELVVRLGHLEGRDAV